MLNPDIPKIAKKVKKTALKKSETKNNESRISGAIFDEGHDSQETAFHHAVDMINLDRSLLVRTRLIAHIERIPRGDSFKATKKGILKNDFGSSSLNYLPFWIKNPIFGSKIHFWIKNPFLDRKSIFGSKIHLWVKNPFLIHFWVKKSIFESKIQFGSKICFWVKNLFLN